MLAKGIPFAIGEIWASLRRSFKETLLITSHTSHHRDRTFLCCSTHCQRSGKGREGMAADSGSEELLAVTSSEDELETCMFFGSQQPSKPHDNWDQLAFLKKK